MLKFRIPFFILSIATAFISITSCTDEASLLGLDLLPSSDKNSVKYTVTSDVEGFIFRVDTVMTSHGSVTFLGLINDPLFGRTEASIITQFIYSSKAPDFGDNPMADSIFIFLSVQGVWGDSLTPIGFDLFEMNTNLHDTSYYNTFDPTGLYNPERIGTVEVIPQDTFLLKIPVPLTYGQRIVEIDTSLSNHPLKFLDEFSGFYLQPRLPNGGIGSMIKVNYFDNKKSQLVVYYHNDDKDSLTFAMQPTAYYPSSTEQRQVDRITMIKHDYSNTSFSQAINDTVNPPSKLYYQSPAGLGIRLKLNGIESWLDSGKVSFEKVILEIPVDKTDDVSLFKRPVALNLFQKRPDSTFYYIFDHYMNGITEGLPDNPWDSYYGKNLQNDSLYRFTITNHYQRALNSKDFSPDLFIFTGTSSQFGRVVFKNDEENKIRLKITYSLH